MLNRKYQSYCNYVIEKTEEKQNIRRSPPEVFFIQRCFVNLVFTKNFFVGNALKEFF